MKPSIGRTLASCLVLGCTAGQPAGPATARPAESPSVEADAPCEWQPTVTVHVRNQSSMAVEISFGSYKPARAVNAFSNTTYRVARVYLEDTITLQVARGGLRDESPATISTEYVPCNDATLIIGPRPNYSFFIAGVSPDRGQAGRRADQTEADSAGVVVDSLGVLRWKESGDEVALFGVNYTTPFAYAYRALGYRGVDRKRAIDTDLMHLGRLGLDAYRIHVWDREVTDADGNLQANDHLDLLDYLLARAAERGIRVILTPIAWWGAGYPESDPETHGLSDGHSKGEMTTDPSLRAAQENYLRQFVGHVNPYTGFTPGDDPNLLAIEIFNEPSHPGSPAETTAYIDAMAAALRDAGFDKPIFYNISEHYTDAHGRAVCAATIDGVSHQWYPTGLVRNSSLGGDMLPNVERYTIPYADFPACRDKARMVYEFDAADIAGSYMYPAMARSFRAAGFQWATQFAYDPLAIAWSNTEYQTHFLNLVYTPGKAISFMIAGEAFRRVPRLASFGRHPDSDRFGPFRVSYEEDLSEMVDDTLFLYSNDTRTAPGSTHRLRHIAGVGSSPVVTYDGAGAYFLDRIDDGIWRLEVYPDAAWVVDPFTRPSLEREAVRIMWRTRSMWISVPDLGDDFTAEPMDEGNRHRPTVRTGTLDVRPGVYLLRRAGVRRPDWTATSVVAGRPIGEFAAPPASDGPTVVLHSPPAELPAGQPFTIVADVVSDEPVDSVTLHVRHSGSSDSPERRSMAARGAFGWEVLLAPAALTEGRIDYSITTWQAGRATTWPEDAAGVPAGEGSTADRWQVPVVETNAPLLLFEGRRDRTNLIYPNPFQYVPFVTDIVPGDETDRLALRAVVQDLSPSPQHFAVRTFLTAAERTRLGSVGTDGVLHIRARASGRATDRLEVALIERGGAAWGVPVELDDQWRDIAIPLSSLRKVPLAILPRPYPQFLPYLRETVTSAPGPRLRELDGLQFAVAPDLFAGGERDGAHGFEVERVVFEPRR